MKDTLTYVGIIALALFSFYYTNKVMIMGGEKDPIVLEIMKLERKWTIVELFEEIVLKLYYFF